MDRVEAMNVVSGYTADQWGLVTTAQATAVGVDRVTLFRLVDAGLLTQVRRGVYLATAVGDTAHLEEKAVWLALNPSEPAWKRPKIDPGGGVLSHRTAALVHELGDLLTAGIEITVARRRTSRDPGVKLRRGHLVDAEVTLVDGLPVTSIERTVVDLLREHVDASHAGEIIHRALVGNRLDLASLVPRIAGFSRRYGVADRGGDALVEHLLGHVRREPVRSSSVRASTEHASTSRHSAFDTRPRGTGEDQ